MGVAIATGTLTVALYFIGLGVRIRYGLSETPPAEQILILVSHDIESIWLIALHQSALFWTHPALAISWVGWGVAVTIVVIPFLRAHRRINAIARRIADAAENDGLVKRSGLCGQWPTAKEALTNAIEEQIKEINDSSSSIISIMGTRGAQTYGSPGAPLYSALEKHGGPIRIILSHPESKHTRERAEQV